MNNPSGSTNALTINLRPSLNGYAFCKQAKYSGTARQAQQHNDSVVLSIKKGQSRTHRYNDGSIIARRFSGCSNISRRQRTPRPCRLGFRPHLTERRLVLIDTLVASCLHLFTYLPGSLSSWFVVNFRPSLILACRGAAQTETAPAHLHSNAFLRNVTRSATNCNKLHQNFRIGNGFENNPMKKKIRLIAVHNFSENSASV